DAAGVRSPGVSGDRRRTGRAPAAGVLPLRKRRRGVGSARLRPRFREPGRRVLRRRAPGRASGIPSPLGARRGARSAALLCRREVDGADRGLLAPRAPAGDRIRGAAMTIDCDVLIIGSGAAGATLAATLAELTPLRIVLVDRGGYFGREAMTQREWPMMQRLYAGGGTRATDDGAIAVRGGECVGGGTTVNVALCLDPVPRVWEGWRRERGLTGFSFDPAASDHGVLGLNMADCLAEVRRRRTVNKPHAPGVTTTHI